MAATASIFTIGDKLIVGQIDTSYATAGQKLLPGTTVLNGPVFVGATPQAGVARASCMIGPPLGPSIPASLEVTGISNIIGNLNVPAISNFTGVANFGALVTMNSLEIKQGIDLKNSQDFGNGQTVRNSNAIVNGALTVSGIINCGWLTGQLESIRALAGKGFDIPHPTKKEHRLRYICLEGPEVGAYIRGTLNGSDIIELPEYWRKLVYPESITVNLTPIGQYQELYVEENIEWGTRIKVKNNSGTKIHCHYTVFAERVTHDKLQTEYRGLTPYDYPGDNSEYALGGWDYAVHKGEPKTSDL
jgi:hypothetical protein